MRPIAGHSAYMAYSQACSHRRAPLLASFACAVTLQLPDLTPILRISILAGLLGRSAFS
jgi:hypothetical protein